MSPSAPSLTPSQDAFEQTTGTLDQILSDKQREARAREWAMRKSKLPAAFRGSFAEFDLPSSGPVLLLKQQLAAQFTRISALFRAWDVRTVRDGAPTSRLALRSCTSLSTQTCACHRRMSLSAVPTAVLRHPTPQPALPSLRARQVNHDHSIDLKELKQALAALQIPFEESHVKMLFEEIGESHGRRMEGASH